MYFRLVNYKRTIIFLSLHLFIDLLVYATWILKYTDDIDPTILKPKQLFFPKESVTTTSLPGLPCPDKCNTTQDKLPLVDRAWLRPTRTSRLKAPPGVRLHHATPSLSPQVPPTHPPRLPVKPLPWWHSSWQTIYNRHGMGIIHYRHALSFVMKLSTALYIVKKKRKKSRLKLISEEPQVRSLTLSAPV